MDLSLKEKIAHSTLRKIVVALSLASLCFIPTWREILDPASKHYYYFMKSSPRWIEITALTVNILLLTLLLLPLALLALRPAKSLAVKVAQAIFLLMLMVPLNAVRLQFPGLLLSNFAPGSTWITAVTLGLISLFIIAGIVKRFGLWRITGAAAVLLLILSPFTLVAYAQATWFSIKYTISAPDEKQLSLLPIREGQRTRVLWLIFDELDQRLLFQERPAGLKLPEFDRLRDESLYASNVFPPAVWTEISVPSLLTGKAVAQVRHDSPNELSIKFHGGREWFGWSTQPNIFSRAREAGYNTAVVGWFHPYCRLFGTIPKCYWDSAKDQEDPQAQNIMHQLSGQAAKTFLPLPLLNRLIPKDTSARENLLKARAASHRAILDFTKEVASDPNLGLVFVHLEAPHPPAFYDKAKQEFAFDGNRSYLDGLALADRTLGEIRRAMEEAGVWDTTTVLVSSDHWWRANRIWSPNNPHRVEDAPWTEEEALISQGEIDDRGQVDARVPFLLKLAGERNRATYESPFNSILSHDILLAVLRGEVSTQQDAIQWLTKNGSMSRVVLYKTFAD